MKKHDIKTLPKWAQKQFTEMEERIKRAESTLPWTKPGMEWFTIVGNKYQPPEFLRLFSLHESGAHCICSIGPKDVLFIGRGK